DGVTFDDLGRSEVFAVARELSRSLTQGTYRPGRGRSVNIPKPAGGTRPLTIRNLIDRVAAKALQLALAPRWENVFLGGSRGFRPGRSHLTLLADLARVMSHQGRWVLAADDVRKAFDSVLVADALADHEKLASNGLLDRMPHEEAVRLLKVVEAVLRGG